jgi:hypothetical protein
MTEFEKDMQLVEHYRDRMQNEIEICDCEICQGEPLSEVREWAGEVSDYWSDADSETH